jgi:hypothetical protein
MKKLILLFMPMLFISFNLMCQDMFISNDTAFERQTANWYFTGVINVDSTISKDVLYQKSRQWFSESFVSANAVIDNADKDAGIIYGKGNIPLSKDVDGRVVFIIEIRCKNGKVKYTISNFKHENACIINTFGNCTPGAWGGILNYGALTQPEAPYSYGKSGRKADKFWNSVKDQTKSRTFNMVQSFKTTMNSTVMKEKDSW